ncbi:hypothetical protein CH300_13735 [Rhodococcus sp. 15-1154-1]|nr:HNH endonuclease signature motif containing protein [Rhodococcus sp. 15-1154-1]OZF04463.1 hypothetical protein CH300_13735 [Rhodococcus sp. 15-1154-1]
MGKPGGIEERVRSEADAAAHILDGLAESRRAVNRASAELIRGLYALGEFRLATEADIHSQGGEADVTLAQRAVECEASVTLALSRTATRERLIVGRELEERLPAILDAFRAGDLDYQRVRTVALVLSKASDNTVRGIEADVLASARRCSIRRLRERIWAHWFDYNEAEALAARKAAESEERCASIKHGADGMATLFAKMTALEGVECNSVLDEIAGTVCAHDPRSTRQLRGHALVALPHREEAIACLCGREDCPVRGSGYLGRRRRPHLLQILISAETLLGLASEPATLGDGTVLDPDTARLIAGDARWQILLTEFLDAAKAQKAAADDSSGDTTPEPEPEPDTITGSPGEPRAFRIIARGRTRSAATLPDPNQARTGRNGAGRDVRLSAAIDAFLAAVGENPSLASGIHPDGHGGFSEPPAGALTYRPSAELAALTRATHCTCTFPGCSVPAAQCEIDHVVPFDHTDPLADGWTVASNLQPLCAFHHQAKTMKLWAAAKLDGDSVFWTSRSGLRRITPSSFGTVMVPGNGVPARKNKRTRTPRPTAPTGDPPDELYAPTWWETYIGEYSEYGDVADTDRAAYVPSLGDIARLTDPTARADAIFLRERFLEHRAVVTARERYRPPPF